jgi:hypothetical protein
MAHETHHSPAHEGGPSTPGAGHTPDEQGRHVEHLGPHAVHVRLDDGRSGHLLMPRPGEALALVRSADGTHTATQFRRHADGHITADPILFERKGCLDAEDWCTLEYVMNTVPEDQWPPWVERWSRLEMCPGQSAGDCQPGPADFDPCPTYNDVCGLGVPIISPVFCGVGVVCPFLR